MWDKLIGPGLIVYLASITVGGIWWAATISARVSETERLTVDSTKTSERITRLETLIIHVDQQLNRIEDKLDRRSR